MTLEDREEIERDLREDDREEMPPRQTSHDCVDGFCGALDCKRCHPLTWCDHVGVDV
jgi:hypothetical protein